MHNCPTSHIATLLSLNEIPLSIKIGTRHNFYEASIKEPLADPSLSNRETDYSKLSFMQFARNVATFHDMLMKIFRDMGDLSKLSDSDIEFLGRNNYLALKLHHSYLMELSANPKYLVDRTYTLESIRRALDNAEQTTAICEQTIDEGAQLKNDISSYPYSLLAHMFASAINEFDLPIYSCMFIPFEQDSKERAYNAVHLTTRPNGFPTPLCNGFSNRAKPYEKIQNDSNVWIHGGKKNTSSTVCEECLRHGLLLAENMAF
ncbi:hypothetical protein V6259_12845 [Marinomonas sp. TI.3.20]|uniref:hypothetical protein n=1 Tax=Marinomonas sp. TI.3.20 TaxID=3121296 RepID=UPI00311EF48E